MSYYNSDYKNFSLKELDYSLNSEINLNIDDRVLKLCNDAEKNYLENQNKIKEIKSLKNIENKINIDKQLSLINSNKDLRKDITKELKNRYAKYNIHSDNTNNNLNKCAGLSISNQNMFHDKQPFTDSINKSPNNRNSISIPPVKIPENKESDLNKKNNSNQNFFRKSNELWSKSNNKNSPKNKWSFKSNDSSANRHCKACEIKKRISNIDDIRQEGHTKFQLNVDINNTIIEAKQCMKKLNYKKANEILKLPIIQGIKHSDLYYLFGEVNRILKLYENSEKYFLEALLFEHHSPYVFYSLGLLYQEINNYKESVSMFKHFLQIIETAEAYFQLSKSYSGLKKYLKAAMHITRAVNLNPNCYDYFMFRAQIYDIMGFSELSMDDIKFAKNLRNI